MSPDDPNREFWERHVRQYERFVTGPFAGPLPRMLQLTADAVAGADSVLEVGAGTGLVTAAIAPRVRHLVATDYAGHMLDALRERLAAAGISNVDVRRRDLYDLDDPPGSFDAVVAANVLHLVPDPDGAIRALCRVLRPGGRLITPTFAHGETLKARLISYALALLGQPMHRRLTATSLRQLHERHGLDVTGSETIPGPIPVVHVESGMRQAIA